MGSVTQEGIFTAGRLACLPRQGKSNPDTGIVFGLRIFTAHQSGPMNNRPDARGPLSPGLPQPHHHLPPEKNLHCSLSRVLELKPADFDLSAGSPISKTISGDCCLVCNSTAYPITFCFSGLYFE